MPRTPLLLASLYPDENEKHGGDGRYHVWFLSPSWVAASGLRVTAYASGRFGLSGLIRNEGVELSVVSHPLEGLSVVAGLLAQRPRMVDAPEGIGPLAVAIAEYSGVVEVDYEPDRWRGFGVGLSVTTNGPADAKADNSVETEGYTTLDLGLRYSFDVRNAPVSVRASVTNVTDEFAWESQDDEGFRWIQQRAFQLVLVTDIR